ncbi:unnamed protein product [Bursaphelenchus okinawaensis]|uniref:MFS domain-containing protein n=1 Tax=Bursaphelenchus okinawaensis TaxID=465554 RepID=A0A811L0Y7_9BILA|nr:unnamed protein product [Bursaphelenchus okinawaensis]CAG9114534.1 unnamed protein product [Bursaphelenchus okinawaensis]
MQTDWRAVYILTSIGLLMTFRVSSMNSGIWAYMQKINPKIEESFYGAITSAENVVNLVTSFTAGVVCNKLSDTKLCTVTGMVCFLLSVICYLVVEIMPSFDKLLFMGSQITFGFAMGLTSVARTHLAMASTEEDRPKAMSFFHVATSAGMGVGPFLTIAAALINYPGLEYLFGLHLNVYTIPPFVFLICTTIVFFVLIIFYNGRLHLHKSPSEVDALQPKLKKKLLNFKTPYDKLAVLLCFLTRMVLSSTQLFIMVIGSPYMKTVFGWSSDELITFSAAINTFNGVNGVVICLSYTKGFTQKHLSERAAIVISMSLILIFYIITYPYPFYSSTIPYEVVQNSTIVQYGCSSRFAWCEYTPAVNKWVYMIALCVCFSISVPLLILNLDILYSKILGNIKQGAMQGAFLVLGECVNIVGPLVFTNIYEWTGPAYLWLYNIASIAVILLLFYKFYDRMVSASANIKVEEVISDELRDVTKLAEQNF